MDKLQLIVLIAPSLLFAMVAHEYAHGYAALKQGDPTAYQLGRLTWNPVKHLDPFMSVILPIAAFVMSGMVFGGAKPIPVNPRNYRNFKRGDIIVSLAGVTTNLLIALLSVPLVILLGIIGREVPMIERPLAILQLMLDLGIGINLLLAVFNLMPIPPLDGSHVFKYLLPLRLAVAYENVARYGIIVLMALLYFGSGVIRWWLSPALFTHRFAESLYFSYMLPNPFTA